MADAPDVLSAKSYSYMLRTDEVMNIWLTLSRIKELCCVNMTCKYWWVNMRECDLRHTIWNFCLWIVYSAVTTLV
jgi:hypothetical protein